MRFGQVIHVGHRSKSMNPLKMVRRKKHGRKKKSFLSRIVSFFSF